MGSNAFDIVTDLHEDWQVVFVLVAAVLAETHDDFLNILAFGDGGSFGDLFTDHSAGWFFFHIDKCITEKLKINNIKSSETPSIQSTIRMVLNLNIRFLTQMTTNSSIVTKWPTSGSRMAAKPIHSNPLPTANPYGPKALSTWMNICLF